MILLDDLTLKETTSLISIIGISLGAIALMLAFIHFWAGPFTAKPVFQQTVTDKVIALKESVLSTINGEKSSASDPQTNKDIDKIVEIVTVILAALAIILGVIGYANKEAIQVSSGAIFLGVGAMTFKMLTLYLNTN